MEQEYIQRLIYYGYSPCNAYFTYHDFMRAHNYSFQAFEEFLADLEAERVKECEGAAVCG